MLLLRPLEGLALLFRGLPSLLLSPAQLKPPLDLARLRPQRLNLPALLLRLRLLKLRRGLERLLRGPEKLALL